MDRDSVEVNTADGRIVHLTLAEAEALFGPLPTDRTGRPRLVYQSGATAAEIAGEFGREVQRGGW